MQILIGTTNPSKVTYFEELLAGARVSFVTLRDLGITEEPQEVGGSPLENAMIKARFYGRYAQPVICADSGLYLDALALDDPRQPGLHVRRPRGVRLDDEQMIAHYAGLARELGGCAQAYYLDGLAVQVSGKVWGLEATREEARARMFTLIDTPCEARRAGWPLDSISLDRRGVPFLSPGSERTPQQDAAYRERLAAFLREKLRLPDDSPV